MKQSLINFILMKKMKIIGFAMRHVPHVMKGEIGIYIIANHVNQITYSNLILIKQQIVFLNVLLIIFIQQMDNINAQKIIIVH